MSVNVRVYARASGGGYVQVRCASRALRRGAAAAGRQWETVTAHAQIYQTPDWTDALLSMRGFGSVVKNWSVYCVCANTCAHKN